MQRNSDTTRILIAGFGGQGVLFLGKLIALAASESGKQVTWLPSYGPEMRGGTANCGVIVSSEPVGSPIVSSPDILIAMNLPSYQAFEPKVAQDGIVLLDSSLIQSPRTRPDTVSYALPATRMASEAALDGLANMILFGKLLDATALFSGEQIQKALHACLPEGKKHLLEANQKALALGRAYRPEKEASPEALSSCARPSRRAV